MSAEQALFDAYREWHRLAKAAHRAIHNRDWKFLFKCQRAVKGIQPRISNLAREARSEWKQQKTNGEGKKAKLRAVISELMGLLESNQKLLHTCREKALSKREELEEAGRNLKRLQSSYVLKRSSMWSSFS
ncbi:MAG TPA: hypothetical protein VNU95_02415 [Candidatus Acidoferrales bacterium]|jgi:hypothetical protein|nr:hypothetical protein [Candidatus Acidoferrales bacterium]